MANPEPCHEVVIVGGGPVGLMLAIELGRRDIDVLVLERRESRLRHPRAVGIHARSMEIFRQVGLADDIREAGGLPTREWSSFAFMTRLTGHEMGVIDVMSDSQDADALVQCPELPGWCAQDMLEPLLRKHVATLPSVRVVYGQRATSVRQDEAEVTVVARDEKTGAEVEHRGKFLVGADGGKSLVRDQIGVDMPTSPLLSHQMNVCFEADLSPFMNGDKRMMWYIVNVDTQGAVLTYDGGRTWVYSWNYDGETESAGDYSPQRCIEVIRAAIGSPDVDITIVGQFPWNFDSALADRFQVDRVLLVGDAAHRFPPTGGFGMNTGLQDSHNLGWKLHAVLRGNAGVELLETYATERKAVAEWNIQTTLASAQVTKDDSWLGFNPELLRLVEEPEGAEIRQKIGESVIAQTPQFKPYGQQFGIVYDSKAVVLDGSELIPSTVTEYNATAYPGARAPHVWLRSPSGGQLSTVDLAHSRFVVLTPPAGAAWIGAAKELAQELGIHVGGFTIGSGGDYTDESGSWERIYGITSTGVVVVRPDGHVAFRASELPDDPAAALKAALQRVLHVDELSPVT